MKTKRLTVQLEVGTRNEFLGFDDAKSWLTEQSKFFPKDGLIVFFELEFEDGLVHHGKIRCKHFSNPDNNLDIKEYILYQLRLNAGTLTYDVPENYQDYLSKISEEDKEANKQCLFKYFGE